MLTRWLEARHTVKTWRKPWLIVLRGNTLDRIRLKPEV